MNVLVWLAGTLFSALAIVAYVWAGLDAWRNRNSLRHLALFIIMMALIASVFQALTTIVKLFAITIV